MSLEIGERIKEIRGDRTQGEFGQLIERSQNAVKNYEQGKIPRSPILARIAALDPQKRGVDWILTGRPPGGESRVAETPAPYGDLSRGDINMVKELQALLEVADDDIKRHLRQQIQLLWRAVKTTRGRRQGGG